MAYIKGHKQSEEVKEKIRLALKGKPKSDEHKRKASEWQKGRKLTEEHKKKVSESLKGNKRALGLKHTEEARKKMSEKQKGKTPWNTGKTGVFTEEVLKQKSQSMQGKNKGELNGSWQGGKSFEPYDLDWTESLRRSIRERDRYTCCLCGAPQGDIAHAVHHIDYNKKNSNPSNLITLCCICHLKTNSNREYWEKYFNEYQTGRI